MKRKLLILALVVLTIINISALATILYNRWSMPVRVPAERRHRDPLVFFRERLELSESQINDLRARRDSFERETGESREMIREKRRRLMEALRSSQPDTLRIDQLVDEIIAVQAQLEKRVIRQMLQEQATLTPEQREKFLSLFDDHVRKRGFVPWRSPKGRRGPHSDQFRQERSREHGKQAPDKRTGDAQRGE
ncbi:MAG: periplasmic heavy metal sensor [Candidatus Eiseniibacteriota bacterium]|nr:MAG: periplasmic heavy metal sensor [Candidatus Eisenbacteria bacterium]